MLPGGIAQEPGTLEGSVNLTKPTKAIWVIIISG